MVPLWYCSRFPFGTRCYPQDTNRISTGYHRGPFPFGTLWFPFGMGSYVANGASRNQRGMQEKIIIDNQREVCVSPGASGPHWHTLEYNARG